MLELIIHIFASLQLQTTIHFCVPFQGRCRRNTAGAFVCSRLCLRCAAAALGQVGQSSVLHKLGRNARSHEGAVVCYL